MLHLTHAAKEKLTLFIGSLMFIHISASDHKEFSYPLQKK
jgi:hypothetical protein